MNRIVTFETFNRSKVSSKFLEKIPSAVARQRHSPSGMASTILVGVLLCCAAPLAGARKKQSPKGAQRHGNLPLTTPVSDSAAAAVRHMFATPLYVADLSGSVDAAALSSLALAGYSIIEDSPSVQKKIVGLRLAMQGTASPAVTAQLNDDAVFTHNDKFFYYQMGNVAKCERGPAFECAGVRWDGFFESSALRQL